MSFISLSFLIFYLFFISLFHFITLLKRNVLFIQQLLLFSASLFFYAWADFRFLPFLLYVIVISYIGGIFCKNRYFLVVFIIADLAPLLFFKYAPTNLHTHIIFPLGISFFTFQSISYISDCYNKKIEVEKNPLFIILFISFFPIISSGPIQRADKLIPQLKKSHSFDYYDATNGIKIFAWGFVKKFFLANRISLYVNYVYGNIDKQYGLALFFATILYSFQIYFDFSGYSDMAIGIARYMGFDIGKNFDHPYLSQSVGEFWRRWHISLSTWLRDYVYIPLGGSRVALPRIYANIFITFFISGIWHGSTWNFVIWGLLHGFYQCIERILKPVIEKLKIPTWIKIVITFLLISFAWIFFRTETLSQAVIIIQKIVQIPQNIVQLFSHKNQNDFTETIRMMFSLYHNACKGFTGMLISLFSLFIFSCISYFTREKSELCIFNKLPTVIRWIIYYIVFAFIIMQFFNLLSQSTNTEFIYFNF